MNRAERRQSQRAREKRFERFWRENFFARNGLKWYGQTWLTWYKQRIDVHTEAKRFSMDRLAKHNRRIKSTPETKTEHDIEAEVLSMLFSKPGDLYFPVINPRNKKWPQTLELREDKGYYWNLWAAIRGIAKAAWKRQPLEDMLTYLFSNDIARRYGLNKGRQRSQKNDAPAFVNREVSRVYEHDLTSTTDIDQIEMQDIYQQTLSIYERLPRADQLVILCASAKSFEAGYHQVKNHLAREGITTYMGAKKRHETLLKRIPELEELRKALKH